MYATKDDIHDEEVKVVVTMYGCDINLNQERTIIFKDRCNDISRKKKITLDRLRPTVNAAEQHSERAYHQIQYWQGSSLDLELFGFNMVDDLLEPISMNNGTCTTIPYEGEEV